MRGTSAAILAGVLLILAGVVLLLSVEYQYSLVYAKVVDHIVDAKYTECIVEVQSGPGADKGTHYITEQEPCTFKINESVTASTWQMREVLH